MLLNENLVEFVTNYNKPSPYGCTCRFLKIDENWGVKAYGEKYIRDFAFKTQKEMAVHSYAPQVGISFEAGVNYCYLTQVAVPIVEGDEDYDKNYDSVIKHIRAEQPNINTEIENLRDEMKLKGYGMYDVHFGNFGRLGEKLVCIDFGS